MELYEYKKRNTPPCLTKKSPSIGAFSKKDCVLAIGLFDGVHLGHRALIERAKKGERFVLAGDISKDIEEEEITNKDYTNSELFNKILLTKKIDNLVKYNIKEDDLELLSSNYNKTFFRYFSCYDFY